MRGAARGDGHCAYEFRALRLFFPAHAHAFFDARRTSSLQQERAAATCSFLDDARRAGGVRKRNALVQNLRANPQCAVYLEVLDCESIFDERGESVLRSGSYVVVFDDSSHAFAAVCTPDSRRSYFVDSTPAFPYVLAYDGVSLHQLLDGHTVGYLYSVHAKSLKQRRQRKRKRGGKPPAQTRGKDAEEGAAAVSRGCKGR